MTMQSSASRVPEAYVLTRLGNATLRDQLALELDDVWARFRAELASDLPCVNDLVDHVEHYRGKMLRPTLVFASALVCAGNSADHSAGHGETGNNGAAAGQPIQPNRPIVDAHRVLATVVEMVHMATLVHDDILDEADTRRRGVTINRLKGNEAAVMLGDYLISHAYHLCSSLNDQQFSRTVADTTNTVCEGELLQLTNRNNWLLDERTYFDIIRRKTASLCGMCCQLGAQVSGAEASTVDALAGYGEKLGVAFQIVDDVLDLTGSEQTVGKTLRSDLLKGKLTLPLIHHLSQMSSANRQQMIEQMELLVAGHEPTSTLESLAKDVATSGAIEYARQWARRLVDQAVEALDVLPASASKALLRDMAEAVIHRKL